MPLAADGAAESVEDAEDEAEDEDEDEAAMRTFSCQACGFPNKVSMLQDEDVGLPRFCGQLR